MANTPKKKNAGSSAKSGSKRRSAPPPPAYNAQARIIGGIVCLLLALCVLVTYFNVDAILLTFLANVLKGCVGYGYWLAAPALLYAGIVLVGHKGRPVKLRTTCTLLLPVLVGMVLHLLLSRGGYAFSLENIKPMWKDGQSLLCGGVVSGLLAVAMEALLSRVVSLILTILLTLLAVLGALQIKPAELAAEMKRRAEERARWEDEDDYYDDEEEAPARPAKPVKESAVTPTAQKTASQYRHSAGRRTGGRAQPRGRRIAAFRQESVPQPLRRRKDPGGAAGSHAGSGGSACGAPA